ncbi:phage tail tape measure protein, partial [Mycolicibacterium palauense]|uniref:phage tail tape measure protein n=1 Tax=Mycolicibacterium palauense TaxID=2034511 RepID=UPI0011459E46
MSDLTMVVGTAIDDNALRRSSNGIQRRFDRLGQNLGGDFMTQFADGAAAKSPKLQRALDKAADATGRLRSEQEKLDALTASGNTRRDRMVTQSERVAKARRDEARAHKEAATAAKDYGQAGENASESFLGGFRSGLGSFGNYGQQAADRFGGGLSTGLSAARMTGIGATAGAAIGGGIVAAVGAAATLLGPAIADGMDILATRDLFQARMGLDEASMSEYAQAAGRAYANNFGVSVADNLSTAQLAKRAGLIDEAATDAQVQHVVEQLQGLSTITESTAGELSRSITTMMRNGLAGSVSEASDIITAGFQKGLDVSGDWLDTINEYSTQARKLGLDASEYLTLLSQGLEGGARDTDKVADALKEFSIRAVDASKTTREGFEALGFSADDMAARFADGGDSAKAALGATFDAIRRIDDPMQQALIWQRLFGTQFEDMGDAVNRFDLDPVKNRFRDMRGVSDDATKTATENFKSEWQEATRAVGTWFDDLKTKLAGWATDAGLPQAIKEIFGRSAPQIDPGAPGIPGIVYGPQIVTPGPALNAPVTAAPGVNPLDVLTGGATAPDINQLGVRDYYKMLYPDQPAGAPVDAPVAGERTPILTDEQAQAQKDAEQAAKAKPAIDPRRYSLDSVPIGGFDGLRVDQLPGVGIPAPGLAGGGPLPPGPGYGAFSVDQQKVFDAETSLISQGQSVENARRRLLELEADSNASQADLNEARTAVTLAERQYLSQQQKLAEAQQGTWKKMQDTAESFSSGMEDIGAALDNDFGLSDGIPGLVENLVKAAGSLAAAPLLGPLSAIKAAAGDEGSGLLGMLASNGAFGPRFQPGVPDNSGIGVPGYPYSSAAGPMASQGSRGNLGAMLSLAQWASGRTDYAPASDLIDGLADCSGSISDLYEVLTTGKSSPNRMFTTTSFGSDADAAKLGFLPGYMPGAFNIGVNPYPGQSGHMAATLPNGVNFEGGGGTGGGAQYGGSAAGALDPQFEKRYYLPLGPAGSTSPLPSPPAYSAPELYSSENTSPGLTNPAPAGGSGAGLPGIPEVDPGAGPLPALAGGGGGSMLPGAGMPQAAPFMSPPGSPANPIGPSLIPGQAPGAIPGAGAGMTQGIGGLPLAAAQAAASGLDALAPGAGAAANLALQLGNRTVGFLAQQAGTLASGIFETLSVSGSKGPVDPLKTLPGRVLAGIAGARPSIPNTAGGGVQQQPKPDAQQNAQQPGQGGGPLVEIKELHQQPGQEPTSVANEVA